MLNEQFVGATDSAAPCAMMLDLAETLNPLLESRMERLHDGLEDDDDIADMTLQLVFFDGEEAFADWTDTDSIYGARPVISNRFGYAVNCRQQTSSGEMVDYLHSTS